MVQRVRMLIAIDTLWSVHSCSGYALFEYDGTFIFLAGMACNSKAYLISTGKTGIVINDKTPDDILEQYTNATGKTYVKSTEDCYF